MTALRGLNNERGEFLITTLQVVNLSLTSTTGAVVFPHYADGGGWTTQIALVNPTDNPISGVVQFLDQQGVTISTTEYAIPARWSQSIKTPGSAATTQTGSVRVLPNFANPSPGGVAIFSSNEMESRSLKRACRRSAPVQHSASTSRRQVTSIVEPLDRFKAGWRSQIFRILKRR